MGLIGRVPRSIQPTLSKRCDLGLLVVCGIIHSAADFAGIYRCLIGKVATEASVGSYRLAVGNLLMLGICCCDIYFTILYSTHAIVIITRVHGAFPFCLDRLVGRIRAILNQFIIRFLGAGY